MKPLSIGEIAGAIDVAAPQQNTEIPIICTDTRALRPGCLFVALRGESFDGNDFVGKALEAGAAYVISDRPGPVEDPRVLQVRDSREALLRIAGHYRRLLGPKVVGITGSVGKTTTKEMVACVLEAGFRTLKTPANLNNEIGLSQTILSLEPEHGAAVLEMGTDGEGQMLPLARCAAPDIGIITNVGVTHLSQFGNREGILREKLMLCQGLSDGAPLLLCGDNDLLRHVHDDRLRVYHYGLENSQCAVRATSIVEEGNGTRFEILYEDQRYPALLPIPGRHNVTNALAAFLSGVLLGIPPQTAADALENYRSEGMRQKMVRRGGILFVEDCYNASPESMQAAISTLDHLPAEGKRILLLSDMLELGAVEEAAHRTVGAQAAGSKADALLCTGPLSTLYVEGAQAAGLRDAVHYGDRESLAQALAERLSPGDVVWAKASRSMFLERVLEQVYRKLEPDTPKI